MARTKIDNPFPTTTYQGKEYFCDREKETSSIIKNLANGNSITLISQRRIGKTGLIAHVLEQLPKNFQGIYIDILETENLNHFLNHLAGSIIRAVPEKSGFGKIIWDFVKSLRPVISFDSLDGTPQVSFDMKQKETESNINNVFQLLDKQPLKTIIAIDEFQQIVNYPEPGTDAWLRSRIQQLKNVNFIFSGSRQHLMTELFSSPTRPFFRSTQTMKLEKINFEIYGDFIEEMFGKYKKEISRSIVNAILEWTNCHTYYVQVICNRVFSNTHKKVTEELWKQQAYEILKEQEIIFFSFRNMLTKPQWKLFKAIASEGTVYHPTSKEFLVKHHLGTSATVLRSLRTLMNYELVYGEPDTSGNQFYSVYDVFFQRWAENH